MIRGRRGDIAFTLMVIVALVLAGGALYSFISFKDVIGTRSIEVSDSIISIDFLEQYVGKSSEAIGGMAVNCDSCQSGDLKGKYQEIANRFDPKNKNVYVGGATNFFGRVRNGDFEFAREGEDYVFMVSNVFVEVERDKNSIRRDFNIELRFNSVGSLEESFVSSSYCPDGLEGSMDEVSCHVCKDNNWIKREKSSLSSRCMLKDDVLPEPFGNSCSFLENLCNSGGGGDRVDGVLIREYHDPLSLDTCMAEEERCVINIGGGACAGIGGSCVGSGSCDAQENVAVDKVCKGSGEVCCVPMPDEIKPLDDSNVVKLQEAYDKLGQKTFLDLGNYYINSLEVIVGDVPENVGETKSFELGMKMIADFTLINELSKRMEAKGGSFSNNYISAKSDLIDSFANKNSNELAGIAVSSAILKKPGDISGFNALAEGEHENLERDEALVLLKSTVVQGRLVAKMFSGSDEQERRINELHEKIFKDTADAELLKEVGIE